MVTLRRFVSIAPHRTISMLIDRTRASTFLDGKKSPPSGVPISSITERTPDARDRLRPRNRGLLRPQQKAPSRSNYSTMHKIGTDVWHLSRVILGSLNSERFHFNPAIFERMYGYLFVPWKATPISYNSSIADWNVSRPIPQEPFGQGAAACNHTKPCRVWAHSANSTTGSSK